MADKTQQIVAYTRKDADGVVKINIDAFAPAEKKQLQSFTAELMKAMQEHASTMLKIGKVLCEVRNFLSDRGDAMKGYVNSIPGFAQATAYRYMARYEMGTKMLPKPLLDRTLARGLEMVGVSEDKPFGRYTEAVKKLEGTSKGLKIKDCTDEKKAEQYLNNVVAEFQKMPKGSREKVTRDSLVEQAAKYVLSCWKRLPDKDKKVSFFSETFGYIINSAGFDTPMSVHPKESPAHWEKPKKKHTGRPKGTKKGSKVQPATSEEPNEE